MAEIYQFKGGIHPPDSKDKTAGLPLQRAPLQEQYTVPLLQHIGAEPTVAVKKKEQVHKGQLLAEASGFVSSSIHAPTSGTIKNIGACPTPSGKMTTSIEITADGEDEFDSGLVPIENWHERDPKELIERIASAGIVGMGGAAFPTHVKLSPPPTKTIDTLIINGAECEPCLTADHRLMLEERDKIITGARLLGQILGIPPEKGIYLAIEDNKPDAISRMEEAAEKYGVKLIQVPTNYPQGAEKQLIYAATGRQVPSGGLPMDIGCIVQNVATAKAVTEAVTEGMPLIERPLTITGTPMMRAGNWHHRIGTTLEQVIRLAGGIKEQPAKLIIGGPMMGIAVSALDIPVVKGTSGILLQTFDEVSQFTSGPCISCGRCVDRCPMRIMPGSLSKHIENERFDLAEQWNVMDCIECGCCAYVCPTSRPLVQHFKRAKMEITAKRKAAAQKAETGESDKK
ncbi:MAG: electron transport complex subunit RsxC [Verrucomicrobiota bacterium]